MMPMNLGIGLNLGAGGGGAEVIVPTTWNPEDKGTNVTLSNGDLTATNSAAEWNQVRSTTSKTDKRYFEVTINAAGAGIAVGVANAALNLEVFWNGATDGVFYYTDGNIYHPFPTVLATPGTFTTGDVIGCAYDPAGTIKYNKNGGAFTADLAAPGIGATFFAMISMNATGVQATANFAPASPPVGYSAWNS